MEKQKHMSLANIVTMLAENRTHRNKTGTRIILFPTFLPRQPQHGRVSRRCDDTPTFSNRKKGKKERNETHPK